MPVGLYADVHIDRAIVAQLRLRQVDVLTAQDDNAAQFADDNLLDRASALRRPIVTHDIRFKAMAEDWQRHNRWFCGLIFGHQMQLSIGAIVNDLELLAKATDESDWQSVVERLPL